jgi:hypothetical protein
MVGVVGRAPRVVRNEEVLNSSLRGKFASQKKLKNSYRVEEESDSVVDLVVLIQRRMSGIVAFTSTINPPLFDPAG